MTEAINTAVMRAKLIETNFDTRLNAQDEAPSRPLVARELDHQALLSYQASFPDPDT